MVLIPGTELYKELGRLYVITDDHWVWIGRPNTLYFEYNNNKYRVQHTVCLIDGLPSICINPNHTHPVPDKTIVQVCIYADIIAYTKGAVE